MSDLEAIRQALGGDQITYVGFSSGTLIGLRYAERFPDGLRAMVSTASRIRRRTSESDSSPTELEPITAPGAPPILVVGNTGDPVTPFESAERVAAHLQAGQLLTYAGSGHTTYSKNECADAHIDSYLLDLTLPAESASC